MLVEENLKLAIATAPSRFTTMWQNKYTTWGKLVAKLGKTKTTKETQAEYLKMGKDQQDSIKDVGGFVGGHLKEGKRSRETVLNRSIVTLDIDFGEAGMWDKWVSKNATYACVVYSTHKHKPDKPRLRVVVPLDREVNTDEYEAIARKVADELCGVDYFDDTTYQPSRLMYFPSTSCDGEFFYRVVDKEVLKADDVLAKYPKGCALDASFWPYSSRVTDIATRSKVKEVEDPTLKKGQIGAFCRAYTISDAIDKFLADVYAKGKGNRYTYLKGSTANGLVVYDDKWAYSNHGSDPISMKLCNAYDLVRIHLYGEYDASAKPSTPTSSLPSTIKMNKLCTEDSECLAQYWQDKEEEGTEFDDILGEFDDVDSAPETEISEDEEKPTKPKKGEDTKPDDKWKKLLKWNEKGTRILPTLDNIFVIMENDPKIKGAGALDLFNNRIMVLDKCFPYCLHKSTKHLKREDTEQFWKDTDTTELRAYIERKYDIDNKGKVIDAIEAAFTRKKYHPVREYLDGLTWDGVPRLDTLLIEYLGASDTAYTRAVTRKTLVAAVKRIYEPGCKFDYMLTLSGAQGLGKSTIFRVLASDSWFSDSVTSVRDKEGYSGLVGKWIVEMAELKAFKGADRESIKSFISKPTDSYRAAYARNVEDHYRQNIFIGTTNEDEFIEDETGGRRFWVVKCDYKGSPVECGLRINKEVPLLRDQIWAEALEYYRLGEEVYLSAELEETANTIQAEHSTGGAQVGIYMAFLAKGISADWYKKTVQERTNIMQGSAKNREQSGCTLPRTRISAVELYCECEGGAKPYPAGKLKQINEILRKLPGWTRSPNPCNQGDDYGKQRVFINPYNAVNDSSQPTEIIPGALVNGALDDADEL